MPRLPVVIVIVLVVAAVAIWHPPQRALTVVTPAPSASPRRAAHPARAAQAPGTRVVVYVVGAVLRPGLYPLQATARVEAAVRAAGGLRPDADPAGVNLAAHPEDGEEIVVPVRGAAKTAMPAKPVRGLRTRSRSTPHVADVNRATAAELTGVPGIGPAIAARIVAVRERDGLYTTFDQLLDVAGMTQARLDRAQPYLRL
jgi:competence protein ComEA